MPRFDRSRPSGSGDRVPPARLNTSRQAHEDSLQHHRYRNNVIMGQSSDVASTSSNPHDGRGTAEREQPPYLDPRNLILHEWLRRQRELQPGQSALIVDEIDCLPCDWEGQSRSRPPFYHIGEDSIQQNRQQDLLRLLDEFRELQGLPPLPEELHVVVGERSSQISRDRLTKHQGTVSRLVQREKELNLTPEQRAEDLVNFCESLADDLDLAQDSDLALELGLRSIQLLTPEEYNRIQDEDLNRGAEEQKINAGQILGRDLSRVSNERYRIACSTVMLAMDERIDHVYGESDEDNSVLARVQLMMEDVFMRGGTSKRRDSAAREDDLLRRLQEEYLPHMFDNALRQEPYVRQIQDFESRQNSLSPDQQALLCEMKNKQKEIEGEMHDKYQEIEKLLRKFKKESQRMQQKEKCRRIIRQIWSAIHCSGYTRHLE